MGTTIPPIVFLFWNRTRIEQRLTRIRLCGNPTMAVVFEELGGQWQDREHPHHQEAALKYAHVNLPKGAGYA
jgi:hypothetical protein